MTDSHETRRRFMAHFASIGLGATLAPGIVWARMQDTGSQRITMEMITEALKLSGLEFTEDERKAMVDAANQMVDRGRTRVRPGSDPLFSFRKANGRNVLVWNT